MIQNKREYLARGLRGLGLIRLLERVRRPGLLVLTYHRIVEPPVAPFYAGVASATAATLAAELRALAATHRIITLAAAVDLAERGFPLTEPTALITFDDGYRDNHDVARPVLAALGLPATFFLVPDFLDGARLPWWDHLAYVLHTTTRPSLHLDRPTPLDLNFAQTPRTAAIARLVQAYLAQPLAAADAPGLRHGLEARAGVTVDEPALARALFLSWDEARTLAAAGVCVGAHGTTHRALGQLAEADQRHELAESRRRLEAGLGQPIEALAYPYGWPGTFDRTTLRLAGDVGFRLGFSALEGVNRAGRTDRMAIRRLNVGLADPPLLHRARWALQQVLGRSLV